MGTPTGCVGEAPAFWSEYERLSAKIPPLRVRLDGAEERLLEVNRADVDRARARTAREAERLLDLCDLEDEEDRTAARKRFQEDRDRRSHLNEELAFELHALFLASRVTDGFSKWDRPVREGLCPDVVGRALAALRFEGIEHCKLTVRAAEPPDASEPEEQGKVGTIVLHGTEAGPEPGTVTAYVIISRADQMRSASVGERVN